MGKRVKQPMGEALSLANESPYRNQSWVQEFVVSSRSLERVSSGRFEEVEEVLGCSGATAQKYSPTNETPRCILCPVQGMGTADPRARHRWVQSG